MLYLDLGMAGGQTIADKITSVKIAKISLPDLMKTCKARFEKSNNKTLDRFKLLSRQQKEGETLREFWKEVHCLAAKCILG